MTKLLLFFSCSACWFDVNKTVKKVQQFVQKSLLLIPVIKDEPRSNLTTHLLTQVIIGKKG